MSSTFRGASVVLLLTLPALAWATTVGPVTTLGASPATATQRAPALSYDPGRNVYLIVWEDGRSSVALGTELFLARISASGVVQDTNGVQVVVPSQVGDQGQPAITRSPAGHHAITWSDSRSGFSDIYSTRFFADGALFPEPAGTQLTATGTEIESRPQVACALQACLVVYQQTVGGAPRLRGVRVSQSGDPRDTTPLVLVANTTGSTLEVSPVVTASTATFYVAWEDDRNRASGLLGADLFVRTVPDLGTTMPATGTVLSSANYRQSLVALSPLGAMDFLAVWQDQRAGTSTSVGEDIWRQRLSLSGNTLGMAAGLITAPRAQLTPRAATGGGQGLVVWQDFRSGVFGGIYGARIDALGNSLDANGFPLIVESTNEIEHAVVKGPGDDYLVASVRFLPAPARIVYRIVRNEVPAGAMMAVGDLIQPADGTAIGSARFGLARGASGLTVVDGTSYTVTLSRSDVSFVDADLDPARPGHQLAAFGGEVTARVTSLRAGPVTVSVASDEGTSSGSVVITFTNIPPTVSAVTVSPAMPRSDQDLVLTYAYNDINGDAEGPTQIQWTRDGMVVGAYTNQRMVPASATSRREVWRAGVRPSDGTDLARDAVFSNTVTILNTPPAALEVRIEPSAGVKTNTALNARYRYADPDNDPETGSTIAWTLDGQPRADLNDQRTVPATLVRKRHTWAFTVTPFDGTDRGPPVRSATVGIENTVPVARAGDNVEIRERRVAMLNGGASSDADPADVLAFRWRQTSGPAVVLVGANTATASFTTPSVNSTTPIELSLVVSDDQISSPEDRVVVLVQAVPDPDNDGLDDEEEALAGTDPARGDSDRDGWLDGDEVKNYRTNPLDEDSDDDGVRDGAEPMGGLDSDGDNLINALDPDSDNDGVFDGTELGVGMAPDGTSVAAGNFTADADRDSTTLPLAGDSDADGLSDGVEDANKNGRVDLGESDPNDPTSKVGCTPDRMCPAGTVCLRDACRSPDPVDGGLSCTPIAARNTECCAGGCSGGTLVAALCTMPGRAEVCPANATECRVGSCSVTPPPPPKASSCACLGARARSPASLGLAALAAVALFTRRRRAA